MKSILRAAIPVSAALSLAIPVPTTAWSDANQFAVCEQVYVDANSCGFANAQLDLGGNSASITAPIGDYHLSSGGLFILIDTNTNYARVPLRVRFDGPNRFSDSLTSYDYLLGTELGSTSSDVGEFVLTKKTGESPSWWWTDFYLDGESFDGTLQPGQDNAVNLAVHPGVQPGEYDLSFPIIQGYSTVDYDPAVPGSTWTFRSGVVKAGKVSMHLTVNANPANGRMATEIFRRGKKGKRQVMRFTLVLPGYQRGGTAAVYFKAKSAKKWSRVATGVLRKSGTLASVTLKTKKGAIRKSGYYYVEIGSVPYSEGWTTAVLKIR